MPYSEKFNDLIDLYRREQIEFPALKAVSVAMWILESGRGASGLAEQHNNFAGMKYRSEITQWAKRVRYTAHDGSSYYCAFETLDDFIAGYWAFLDRSPYVGWRNFGQDPAGFIAHVGPIWAGDPNYVEKVGDLIPEAEDLLTSGSADDDSGDDDDVTVLLPGRPALTITDGGKRAVGSDGLDINYRGVDTCPYGRDATRRKLAFNSIILHHTSPRHDTEWYVQYQIDGDPGRGGHFGYHFYISPTGVIYQGAPLTKRTNHVKSPSSSVRRSFGRIASNRSAIGITCSGAGLPQGYNPTREQIAMQYDLVFALCDAFEIPFANVFGHGEVQSNRHRTEGRFTAEEVRSWSD